MTIKQYYTTINIHDPKNYFENWYSDVWRRKIKKYSVQRDLLYCILNGELEQLGAKLSCIENGFRFKVEFADEQKYTMFVLKWI